MIATSAGKQFTEQNTQQTFIEARGWHSEHIVTFIKDIVKDAFILTKLMVEGLYSNPAKIQNERKPRWAPDFEQ